MIYLDCMNAIIDDRRHFLNECLPTLASAIDKHISKKDRKERDLNPRYP